MTSCRRKHPFRRERGKFTPDRGHDISALEAQYSSKQDYARGGWRADVARRGGRRAPGQARTCSPTSMPPTLRGPWPFRKGGDAVLARRATRAGQRRRPRCAADKGSQLRACARRVSDQAATSHALRQPPRSARSHPHGDRRPAKRAASREGSSARPSRSMASQGSSRSVPQGAPTGRRSCCLARPASPKP